MFMQKDVAGFNQFIVSHYQGDKAFNGKGTTVFYLKTKKVLSDFKQSIQKVYGFHYAQSKLKELVREGKAEYVNSYSFLDKKLRVNGRCNKMTFHYKLETYK